MEKLLEDKISPALVGLYQALGVIGYTILIGSFMSSLEGSNMNPPDLVVAPLMLTLFVLSAGITGTIVFGLPVYFTFAKNNVKRAISILGFTFLYLIIAVLTGITTILAFSS